MQVAEEVTLEPAQLALAGAIHPDFTVLVAAALTLELFLALPAVAAIPDITLATVLELLLELVRHALVLQGSIMSVVQGRLLELAQTAPHAHPVSTCLCSQLCPAAAVAAHQEVA